MLYGFCSKINWRTKSKQIVMFGIDRQRCQSEEVFKLRAFFKLGRPGTYPEYSITPMKTTLNTQNKRSKFSTCTEKKMYLYCAVCFLARRHLPMRWQPREPQELSIHDDPEKIAER